jgi:uncharacterized membrane protein
MASVFYDYFGREAQNEQIKVRRIEPSDCFRVLAQGFADVVEMPTYPAFVGLFYGVAGAALVSLTSFGNALHLAFPLVAGFTLIGPFVAVGLYEMSRQREQGFPATWRNTFAVFRSPALPSILALGCLLFVIFAAWIEAAQLLYVQPYGPNPPGAVIPFLRDVVTTERGRMLMALGALIGLFFAALALCISVVSFPLMLDREVPLVSAVAASLRISRDNPATIALWGAIVAVLLIVGQLLLFIGLAVVVPTLGHATWHLYRRAFEMELAADLHMRCSVGAGPR